MDLFHILGWLDMPLISFQHADHKMKVKFMNVKLYGANPSTDTAPIKKGAKNRTIHLLFSRAFKLNLKSFFQFYSFYNNPYFLHGRNQSNAKNHEPKLYQILQEIFF